MRKQGLSLRFLRDGSTDSCAFQTGGGDAEIRRVDNYPVEVVFRRQPDYDFVLDQLARNAALNLSMIDRDATHGISSLDRPVASVLVSRDRTFHNLAGPAAGGFHGVDMSTMAAGGEPLETSHA